VLSGAGVLGSEVDELIAEVQILHVLDVIRWAIDQRPTASRSWSSRRGRPSLASSPRAEDQALRTFSIAFPFASSSTSLSR
jgi:hypothetical protein